MSSKNKISVVISAFNEEKKIENCLKSIRELADEIIFIDNQSTDKTVELAKKFTDKIYIQKNDISNIDIQKNFGIEKATGEWILVLDADEIVTKELAGEIEKAIDSERAHLARGGEQELIAGYEIPRKNIIFGKWIQHTGWYPDYQLRLFRNGKGKYEKKHVHEPLSVQGKIKKLNDPIIHYNYETISQFLYKHFLVYAPNEAEELLRKGYQFDWRGIIRIPMSEFLSRYYAREGYRDGFHGLVLSLLMAAYHLAIFIYIWEKKEFIEVKDESIVKGLEGEVGKSNKEINYWVHTQKIKQEKNTFKKITLKIKNKLQIN